MQDSSNQPPNQVFKTRLDQRTGKRYKFSHPTFWKQSEVALLYELYPKMDLRAISSRLRRQYYGVRAMARHLGLRKNPRKEWTSSEIELLASSLSSLELTKLIPRSREAIAGKRWRLKQCQDTARRAAELDQESSTQELPGKP